MRSSHEFLRCSLVGLALIFSGTVGAAGLNCLSSADGYHCEVWPQGARYRYEWHIAGRGDSAARKPGQASLTIRCAADQASVVAVSVIAPAGYVETATKILPACAQLSDRSATLAGAP
jgi:hypothetical protein